MLNCFYSRWWHFCADCMCQLHVSIAYFVPLEPRKLQLLRFIFLHPYRNHPLVLFVYIVASFCTFVKHFN